GRSDEVRDERDAVGEPRALGDDVGERAALDELHREEWLAVGPPAGLVERDDRRVLEARGDAGLADEAGERAGLVAQEDVDGDAAAVAAVPGVEDAAHAAARELAADFVGGGVDGLERRGVDDAGGGGGLARGEDADRGAAAGAAREVLLEPRD